MPNAPASIVGGLAPGTKLGRYRIVRRLALGGMAELYLARQEAEAGFRKMVALKRVLPHLAEDLNFVGMFLDEARLAASLVHPNIAQVTDFGSAGSEYFMVMEFVHGRSVSDLLRAGARGDGIPLDCALAVVAGVASALHHAHEACDVEGRPLGLVHRDVSPSNILVSYEGSVKLVDFGIAKATANAAATRSRTIKGKLQYMSPEQAQGGAIDRRADVFSLGVVLYELSTGKRCFFAEGEFALLNKVADARFEPPSKCAPRFPTALEPIVLRALAKDRDDRYATARDFQRAIEAFVQTRGLSLSSMVLADHLRQLYGDEPHPSSHSLSELDLDTANITAGPTPSPPRRRWRWVVTAGVSIGIGAALGIGATRGDASPPEPTAPAGIDSGEPTTAIETDVPLPPAEPSPDPPRAPTSADDEVEAVDDVDDIEIIDPPPPDLAPHRRGSARRRSRARKKERNAKKTAPPAEFLPPSHRGG